MVNVHLGHKDTNLLWRVDGNYTTGVRDHALVESEAELLAEAESITPGETEGRALSIAQ